MSRQKDGSHPGKCSLMLIEKWKEDKTSKCGMVRPGEGQVLKHKMQNFPVGFLNQGVKCHEPNENFYRASSGTVL